MDKKTVVVDVDKTPNASYRVHSGEHLTLAIVAQSPKVKEASYRVDLSGKHAKATIIGLVIAALDSQFALHTLQHHEAPDTTSDLLVKSVLSGSSSFAYDGEIRVEKSAQKTDAYQRNENLLLSDSAFARSDPSLEILANDVRCTHGATIGTISEEELWYLASRGIATQKAKHLIVGGFLEMALSKISDTIALEHIGNTLWKAIQTLDQ